MSPSAIRTPFARHANVEKTIERDDWAEFFESFTMMHDHWLVSVDGEKEMLPLEGIALRDGTVSIHLGGDISHHRLITIDAASVRVQQDDAGYDEGVEIHDRDGHVTRLQFRSPMPPELVDGGGP